MLDTVVLYGACSQDGTSTVFIEPPRLFEHKKQFYWNLSKNGASGMLDLKERNVFPKDAPQLFDLVRHNEHQATKRVLYMIASKSNISIRQVMKMVERTTRELINEE